MQCLFSSRIWEAPTAQSVKSGSGCRKGPPGLEREGSDGGRTGFVERARGIEKENCGDLAWNLGYQGRKWDGRTMNPLWVTVVGEEGP